MKNDIHRAYERIEVDHASKLLSLEKRLDDLLELSRQCASGFLTELKPVIAVSLKWKFDYLAKTLESPFELEADVLYWAQMIQTFKRLGQLDWFSLRDDSKIEQDVWKRTAHGFDIGWTTTTREERFLASRKIAEERLQQIIEMLGGPDYFAKKQILDCGCGPGRYIDLMRKLVPPPAKIVGMDQGKKLVETLKERFAGDPIVEIHRGTCESLEYKDESFDIVFSNGVIHHTPGHLPTMIKDHTRVLRPGGVMFIMLVGKGGLEMKLWEFLRGFLYDVPIESMLDRFGQIMSALRLQGIVDHMYGEYQLTDRMEFEEWCRPLFKKVQRVPGISGLDITPELYADDPYFTARFGTGHLRYLCFK
jgi:ubiquinone/menaquinone biosynthesis C-methylase UbiE